MYTVLLQCLKKASLFNTYMPISVHNLLSETIAAFLNFPSLDPDLGKSDL